MANTGRLMCFHVKYDMKYNTEIHNFNCRACLQATSVMDHICKSAWNVSTFAVNNLLHGVTGSVSVTFICEPMFRIFHRFFF